MIDLVNTQLKGRSPNLSYADIIIDDEANTVELPNGLISRSVSYTERTNTYRAHFDKDNSIIESCDAFEMMKEQKKTYALVITPKMIKRANQAKQMKTKDFLEFTYFRNGVEGIPSVLFKLYTFEYFNSFRRLKL